jgi:hypothetical protein
MHKQKKRRPLSKPTTSWGDRFKVAGSGLGTIFSALKIVEWVVTHWPHHWPF